MSYDVSWDFFRFNDPNLAGRESVNKSAEEWQQAQKIEKKDVNFRIKVLVAALFATTIFLAGGVVGGVFGLKTHNDLLYFATSIPGLEVGIVGSGIVITLLAKSKTKFTDPEARKDILTQLNNAKNLEELPEISEKFMVRYGFMTRRDARSIVSSRDSYIEQKEKVAKFKKENPTALNTEESGLATMQSNFNSWYGSVKQRLAKDGE